MDNYNNIEFVRRRLKAAKRRYRHHNRPWPGDNNGLRSHSELLGLAHADVIQLTEWLERLEANRKEKA
jgi:hypothetical protein